MEGEALQLGPPGEWMKRSLAWERLSNTSLRYGNIRTSFGLLPIQSFLQRCSISKVQQNWLVTIGFWGFSQASEAMWLPLSPGLCGKHKDTCMNLIPPAFRLGLPPSNYIVTTELHCIISFSKSIFSPMSFRWQPSRWSHQQLEFLAKNNYCHHLCNINTKSSSSTKPLLFL